LILETYKSQSLHVSKESTTIQIKIKVITEFHKRHKGNLLVNHRFKEDNLTKIFLLDQYLV